MRPFFYHYFAAATVLVVARCRAEGNTILRIADQFRHGGGRPDDRARKARHGRAASQALPGKISGEINRFTAWKSRKNKECQAATFSQSASNRV